MQTGLRLRAAFVLLLPASVVLAQSAAPVTAVTLYPGGATIVRTARVEPGTGKLVISDLTTRFATQTLRVDGDAGIRVGQVVVQDSGRTESSNPVEAGLEARIQALRDQEAALDVDAGAADVVKAYLDRLGGEPAAAADRPHRATDAKELGGVVAVIRQAALDALGKKQQVALQKREIDKKIDALERDLKRIRGGAADARTVTVNFAADKAGTIRVSYQSSSAGWKPGYRAELNSANSTLALQRLAQVSQKTGEEWSGVKLSLSTVQPRASSGVTLPQPWLLGYEPPQPARSSRLQEGMYAPAAAPAPAMAQKALTAPGEAPYVPPTFQADGAFATEFVVSSPVTLPSDGREVSLPLAMQSLPAKQRSQVTPRIDTKAVVTAEAAKPEGVWPAGSVQLYRDGSYVGGAFWDPQQSDKLKLAFGRDDLLLVKLDSVKGNSATTGTFDKRNQRSIADRITIKSAHTTPIDVLVVEASPVSTSDEVKVRTAFEPKPTEESLDQRRGVVAWERTLPANGTLAIDLGYTIEYPKEGSITGLR
jgi:uncharacterized protein (TIGR02231 family)